MSAPAERPESDARTETVEPPLTRREALARERAAAAAAAAAAAPAAPDAVVEPSRAPTVVAPEPLAQAAVPTPPVATAAPTLVVPVPVPVPVPAPAPGPAPVRGPAPRGRATASTGRPVSGADPRLPGSRPVARASWSRPTPTVAVEPRRSLVAGRRRAAGGPALAMVAATLFFSSNVTPASATDLGGGGVQTTVTTPIPGQTLAASLVVLTVSERDAYGVTDPPPPPPPPPAPEEEPSSKAGKTGTSTSTHRGSIVNDGTGDIRWPFPGRVVLSSGFGPRTAPCAACSSMHMGLDMTPGAGKPIGAVAAGTVRKSGIHAQFGQYVVIDHVIDGSKVSTLYAHMQIGSSPLVAGDAVSVGVHVGLVGRTGVATGDHLHFEVLLDGSTQIDPEEWLDENAGRTL